MAIGTLRPADGPAKLIAVVFHPPAHSPQILMGTMSPDSHNTHWEMLASGGLTAIRCTSPFLHDTVMTRVNADNIGNAIGASTFTGAQNQLWKAVNPVGKLWYLLSPNGHALQPENLTQIGSQIILGNFNISDPGPGQTWVFPE